MKENLLVEDKIVVLEPGALRETSRHVALIFDDC